MTPRGACGRTGDGTCGGPEEGFGVNGVAEVTDEADVSAKDVGVPAALPKLGDTDGGPEVESLRGVDGIFLGGTKTCGCETGSSVELTVIGVCVMTLVYFQRSLQGLGPGCSWNKEICIKEFPGVSYLPLPRSLSAKSPSQRPFVKCLTSQVYETVWNS